MPPFGGGGREANVKGFAELIIYNVPCRCVLFRLALVSIYSENGLSGLRQGLTRLGRQGQGVRHCRGKERPWELLLPLQCHSLRCGLCPESPSAAP